MPVKKQGGPSPQGQLGHCSVAIVHDFLVERGGAERVTIALMKMFPGATLYTAAYDKRSTYPEFGDYEIVELLGSASRLFRNRHRKSLPLAYPLFLRTKLDHDLVICSSSGLAHLVQVSPGAKFVYCHTPARWLHRPENYFREFGVGSSAAGKILGTMARGPDHRRMVEAARVVSNARVIRNEIEKVYGLETEIVYPVSSLDAAGPEIALPIQPGFFLNINRLLGYKRVDLVLSAARELPNSPFVIVGDGPNRSTLEKTLPENVTMLGLVSDGQLRWLYRNCRSVVLTCAEDFGLVPAEAAAFDKYSIVPDARGFRDRVNGHESTLTYRFGDIEDLTRVLRKHQDNGSGIGPNLRLAGQRAAFQRRVVEIADELVSAR